MDDTTNQATTAADEPCSQCAQLDAMADQVMTERDQYAELLDAMTTAAGAVLGLDFGEHSSANDPWFNALDALRAEAGR